MLPLLILSLVILTGCYAHGTKVDEKVLPAFVKGQTTCADVIATVGKPPTLNTLRDDGSRQVVYNYTQSQVNPMSYIPVAGSFVRSSSQEHTSTVFECAPDGTLMSYSSIQGESVTGTGIVSGARQK